MSRFCLNYKNLDLKSQLKEKELNCSSIKKNYSNMIEKFIKVKQNLSEEIGTLPSSNNKISHKAKHDELAQSLRVLEDKMRVKQSELEIMDQEFNQV